ncbi:sensor histidine kinase [Desulfogranum mediterraneum]|uniref:sensor histidine kinase n=1 Tax=Desulfogranum mediterraneum TaxID=160661 RepID=UPI0003F96F89|nr:HAMP domain-containing sensor histidine kinase [Desulfogranum mediterraneum]
MKLFSHLFGYLLAGIIILTGTDEYLNFRAEINQYETDMIANAVQNGRSISGMIAHVWQENGPAKAISLLEDSTPPGGLGTRWVWLDELRSSVGRHPGGSEQWARLNQGETISFKSADDDGVMFRYTYVPVEIAGARRGGLELSQSLLDLQAFTQKMLTRACIITALLALTSGLILFVFIHFKIRVPLNHLMAHAKRIGKGDFSTDQGVSGRDELAEMARVMNEMCARLLIAKDKIRFEYHARLKTLDQLRHTERLSTFGLLSADIAHELGTPLNVVDGRAKMIIREELSPAEIRTCATIIQSQAERMATIIRQLLDFTRRPKQQVAETNISLLIKQIFQLLHPMASKQQVFFSLHREQGTQTEIRVDSSRIQQVLVNLLMNSIQAMPRGGKVCVSLSREVTTTPQPEGEEEEPYLKIQIKDQGEGICQENLGHIFTPFFTTKTIGTGTGLGLSIAHGIMEEHGGWIDVESSGQEGSCFSVYLPIKEEQP